LGEPYSPCKEVGLDLPVPDFVKYGLLLIEKGEEICHPGWHRRLKL